MQPGFDFSAPMLDPQVESPVVPAPIAPSVDLTAKHCSAMGALKAEESREFLWSWMLALYEIEPLTDPEIADKATAWMGRLVPPSTISARRNELIAMGKVESAKRSRKNPKTGVSNSLWQLAKSPTQAT